MSKLTKDIKATLAESVIHSISTRGSKKSSVRLIAKGKRYVPIITIKHITE